MARKKQKEQPVTESWLKHNLPRLLAGLLATGAVGGTGLSYATGSSANERTAKLEVKAERTEQDVQKLDRSVNRIDRRTTRMEEGIKLLLEKHGVKRELGPTEQ